VKMANPKVIIADEDVNYIIPLQFKFVTEFFNKIDLEIITDKEYFNEYFTAPRTAEILIISEDLYDSSFQRHNFDNIFIMYENENDNDNDNEDEGKTTELNINRIFKYSSIKDIFNEIIGKSSTVLKIERAVKKETQVILFYSASGGTGKTTVSMGVCATMAKNYKRVLYINAAGLQAFQHMLDNHSSLSMSDVYTKLADANEKIYSDIKHVIRKELFSYIPPFKASLMSLGLKYSVFEKLITSAKNSGDYDYIVVDADITFDEYKAKLFDIADKVMVVVNQTIASVLATNIFVSNINGAGTDKYVFICNDFERDNDNALILPELALKFSVSEYIEHIRFCEKMKPDDLSKESSIQKITFLII